MSEKEFDYIKQSTKTKAIPQPKILIKDHKDLGPDGNFLTRLVVPVTNFTAGFSKLGHKGIKNILDSNQVTYGQCKFIQASDLKLQIEKMGFNSTIATIASVDAKNMYPSIKYDLIEKAVHYYSRSLNDDDMNKIETLLMFIKFGLSATIISFRDSFYLHDGDKQVEGKGLTIGGGYKSAWLLVDLKMSFLLENIDSNLIDNLNNFGIYQDNGLTVFEGDQLPTNINNWLQAFQTSVNEVSGNNALKFKSGNLVQRN